MKRFETIVTVELTVPNGKGGNTIYKWSDGPFSPDNPHEYYDPRIKEAPTHSGKAGLAIHNQKTQSSESALVISKFGIDNLKDDPRVRNSEAIIKVRKRNAVFNIQSVEVITAFVDFVTEEPETFTITFRSLLSLLDKPLQDRVFDEATVSSNNVWNNPIPVAIGWPRSVPVATVDENNDRFVACDGPALSYFDVETNADYLIPVTDWQYEWNEEALSMGFTTTDSDYGQVTASVEGGPGYFDESFDADALGGIFNPMVWTGSGTSATPNGWTLVEPAATYIYPYSGNTWTRFYNHGQNSGGDFYIETVDDLLTPGAKYKLTVDVWNVSGDPDLWIDVMTGSDYIGRIQLNGIPKNQYTVEIDIIPTGPKLKLQGSNYTEGDLSSAIKDLTVEKYAYGTHFLKNFLYELMVVHGGLNEDQINWSSIDDVAAINDTRLGFYADSPVNILSVLDLVANTFNGWFMEDPDGKISMGVLQDPDSLTPVLYVNDNNIKSGTKCWPDTAPGLTDTYPAKRNWFQFQKENIASGVSETQKLLRSKRYRRETKSSVDVHDFYSHARANGYPDVLFDKTSSLDGAEKEATRICTLFSNDIREFKQFDVTVDEIEVAGLKYGDCVDYYGEKTIILGKRLKTGANRIQLIVWS